jgi:hypothetical protein
MIKGRAIAEVPPLWVANDARYYATPGAGRAPESGGDVAQVPPFGLAAFPRRPGNLEKLLRKHDLIDSPIRSVNAILRAEEEFFHRVWYDRHQGLMQNRRERWDKEIPVRARKAARAIEKKYGKKNLGPYTDFEWGMVNGKLSALRWVLGDDWDMLDT